MPDVTAGVGYPGGAPPQAQQNPLAMLGQVLQIQGAQQGLYAQQQEFKARAALGPILQQSIDPKTGEMDLNKAMVLSAANPDFAWKAPEFFSQMVKNQNVQADTLLKGIEVSNQKAKAISGVALALEEQAMKEAKGKFNSDLTPARPQLAMKDVTSALATVPNDFLSSEEKMDFIKKNLNVPPQDLFKAVQLIGRTWQNVDHGLAAIRGSIASQDRGGKVGFAQTIPATGQVNDLGTVNKTPELGALNAPQAGVTKTGAPTINSAAGVRTFYDADGRPIPGTGPQGAAQPGAPAANVTGLSPMDQKLAEARAKTANDYEEDLNGANLEAQNTVRIIGAMRDELKNFKPGGGAEVKQRLAAAIQSLPGDHQNLVDAIAGGDYGSKQAFEKLATRLATAEMKTNLGASQKFTNLDFSTFMKKTQNLDTDPRALDKMFTYMDKSAWRLKQIQEAHQQAKHGNLPPGAKDISDFPAYATKMMSIMNSGQSDGR